MVFLGPSCDWNTAPRAAFYVLGDSEVAPYYGESLMLLNPVVGGMIECYDSAQQWYAATIIAMQKRKRIKVHYEGWDSVWDEWLHIVKNANRIRPLDPFQASTGRRPVDRDSWRSTPRMLFGPLKK